MGRKRKTTALRNKKLAAQPESVLGNSAHARRRRIRNVLPANGRPLGAKNVVLRDVRQIVEQIVDGYADRIPGILERIEKRNPRDAALVWARLLDYVVAKRAHVVVTPSAPVAPPIDTSNPHTLREAYERVMRGDSVPALSAEGPNASHEPSTRAEGAPQANAVVEGEVVPPEAPDEPINARKVEK